MICEICKTCGELKYDWKEHRCLPIFYYKHDEWTGDEFSEIRAHNFEDAAERFAKKYNEEGDLMNESTEVIISDGNTEKRFRVSAEPDVYYHNEEVTHGDK